MKNSILATQKNVTALTIALFLLSSVSGFSKNKATTTVSDNICLDILELNDTLPYQGVTYYKVQQTSFNGGAIIMIKGNSIELKNLRIYTASGKEVTKYIKIVESDEESAVIDISELGSGLYTIRTNMTTSIVYKS